MIYISILVLTLIFFFGVTRAVELGAFLRDKSQRRNLAVRLVGFLAMSSWIHAAPAILLTVYMRQYGILASELFTGDSSRTTLIAIFVVPITLLAAVILSAGAIWARITESHFLEGRVALIGFAISSIILLLLLWGNAHRVAYVFGTAVPLAIYLILTLTSKTEHLISLYWLPFSVIAVVTWGVFASPDISRNLVAHELATFGAGGEQPVTVSRGGLTIHGSLILLTNEAAYVESYQRRMYGDFPCRIRIPIADSIIAMGFNYGTETEADRQTRAYLCDMPLEVRGLPQAASSTVPQAASSTSEGSATQALQLIRSLSR